MQEKDGRAAAEDRAFDRAFRCDGDTGAGAEASEGIHGASSRRGETSRTSATNARTSSRETSSSSTRSTKDRSASEPLRGSEQQHVSGYGGAGMKTIVPAEPSTVSPSTVKVALPESTT